MKNLFPIKQIIFALLFSEFLIFSTNAQSSSTLNTSRTINNTNLTVLSLYALGNGTVSAGNGNYVTSGTFLEKRNSTLNMSAIAGKGYIFKSWSCSGNGCFNGDYPNFSIKILNNLTEIAQFSIIPPKISKGPVTAPKPAINTTANTTPNSTKSYKTAKNISNSTQSVSNLTNSTKNQTLTQNISYIITNTADIIPTLSHSDTKIYGSAAVILLAIIMMLFYIVLYKQKSHYY